MTQPPLKKFLGWTEKQWAAAIMASLYGAPGVAVVLLSLWRMQWGALGVGVVFILVGYFLFWALSTAGDSKRA